jgi:hypothetical protein
MATLGTIQQVRLKRPGIIQSVSASFSNATSQRTPLATWLEQQDNRTIGANSASANAEGRLGL